MEVITDLKDKRIALAGFGAEGQSAARFLLRAGAKIDIFDAKATGDFPTEIIHEFKGLGARFHFGGLGPFDGFEVVVRSPGISLQTPELAAAAAQGILLTSATRMFFDWCPCPIVGVTGTKGKGTTCSLLHDMLRLAGRDVYLCGNIGAPALDFLDKLRPDSIVIYELSSFQLMDLEKSPLLAVVLMITSEHLDFHPTTKEYVAAKANIVKHQRANDQAVVNMDYPASRSLAKMTPAEVFGVSRHESVAQGAYVSEGMIMLAQEGNSRKLMTAMEVPLAGAHNLENICAAAMAASLLGVPDSTIVQAIRAFKPLPHRLELVHEAKGVKYYDDSISTTPESTIAALRSFQGPKVLVLGGSTKGADWSGLAAELAAPGKVRAVIGIGTEWPKIKEAIKDVLGDTELVEGLESMGEVVRAAVRLAQPGDTVLLSPGCASFGMFQNYKDRGEQFTAAVRALS